MKVAFIDIVHPILQERLTALGYNCIDASELNYEQCIELVSACEGIVVRSRFKMDQAFLGQAKNVKFIARSGAGMENIDIDYCASENIQLFNAPEGNRNAVAEHALGMLLSLFNNIVKANIEIKNNIWDREGNRGVELDGKTVGIIGFGNNGSAFAQKLTSFDVKILAYDKYKSGFGSDKIIETSMKDIYDHADVISFHIPQTEETIGLADEAFFNHFNKPIYVINLARGKVINTKALVKNLKSHKVLGACLDVLEYEKSSFESFFQQEIPSDFKYLIDSDKVVLSPHVGGWTVESYYKLSDVLADKIIAYFHS